MFKKLLIANRGEIAVRIIRACREMGIQSVAVYSDADQGWPHAQLADEAHRLGPAAPAESYLHVGRLLEVARRSGCEAVHPGYGFLAERPEFASACRDADLVFVGPTPEAMALLGRKTDARRAVAEAGVPLAPGTEAVRDGREVVATAAAIGYPLMLKAVAGGGGKGMRVVRTAEELEAAFRMATNEARAAFGDGTLYLERLVDRPRHVEVQVLADQHGQVVALGERECSVQRRHQKVIEEAPSPVVDDELRVRLCDAAVRTARAAGYTNAGTVEFLLDREGHFYFLEVNARIQVEHPVTEMVTGLDLVQEQVRLAAGEPLGYGQQDVRLRGHAIECRISAEDPRNQFFPSTGRLEALFEPSGPGVRVDSGVAPGLEIALHYDPLLAKLIVWGSDREQARRRMLRALEEYLVLGVQTTIGFHRFVLDHPGFRAGRLDTGFVERVWAEGPELDETTLRQAAVLAALVADRERQRPVVASTPAHDGSAWRLFGRRMGLR